MDKLNLFINKYKRLILPLINKWITKKNKVLNLQNQINSFKIYKTKRL